MNIHEYQAKAVLRAFGAPVSNGKPAFTPDEAEAAAKEIGGSLWVVKSQIHAGGRGKGKFKEAYAGVKGGVRLAKSIAEVKANAEQMLGATLVTMQTGPAGKQVNRLYIEEGSRSTRNSISRALVDRATSRVAFVVSTEGGVNIEDVAHKTPEKIVTFSVDPATGIMPHHGRTAARALGLTGELAKQMRSVGDEALRRVRRQGHVDARDQSAGLTTTGQLRVLDAKVAFDDNALFRHPDVVALRDETEEDPKEIEASQLRSQLCRARRNDRLHGQRRRPRHGDDGHHQALRRERRRTFSTSAAAPPRRK